MTTGWTSLGGSHYYFSQSGQDKRWWEAEADCVSRGSGFSATHLAVIGTKVEAMMVGAQLAVAYAWIGMFQPLLSPSKAANWLAVTGGSAIGNDWSNNEPSDGGNAVEIGDENFAQIYNNGTLNDTQGTDSLRYICECDGIPADGPTLSKVPPEPPPF